MEKSLLHSNSVQLVSNTVAKGPGTPLYRPSREVLLTAVQDALTKARGGVLPPFSEANLEVLRYHLELPEDSEWKDVLAELETKRSSVVSPDPTGKSPTTRQQLNNLWRGLNGKGRAAFGILFGAPAAVAAGAGGVAVGLHVHDQQPR